MVTRKEEKNTSSSLQASPSGGSPAGQEQRAHPPRPPSSDPQLVQVSQARTDLGPQALPTSGGQGQGQGLPCTSAGAQSPGIRCQSFRPGWGWRGSRSLLPSRTCPARPGLCPAPLGPGHRVRGRCPPGLYSPLADMVQAAGAEAGSTQEKPGRAWGGKYPRNAHPRAQAPARGKAARRSGDASRWTPGRLGTQRPRGPAAGRGNTDSKRPEQGGARLPASPASLARPPGPGAAGDTQSAVLRRQAGLLSLELGVECSKGVRLLLPGLLNLNTN